MSTLEVVLETFRGMEGYVHERRRAEEPSIDGKPWGTVDTRVMLYQFWFARDSYRPNDISICEIRILVMKEDTVDEEARVYSTATVEQIPHDFEDALKAKISDFLTSNPEYEKVVIDAINESQEWAFGKVIKTDAGVTTILTATAFIKEGESAVTLRVVS